MKITRPSVLRAALGLLLASFVAGCTTGLSPVAQTRSRIQEKTEAFNKLTPQQQGNILGGAIERGNTPDMVYMSLGKPAKIVTSADGHKAMWVYVEYYNANNADTTSPNNPNERFSEGMTIVNPRGDESNENLPKAVVPSGGGAFMAHQKFASTTNSGPMQSLDMPDLRSNTVYVFFYLGRVVEIKLDGDVAAQATALLPKPGKKSLNAASGRKV